MLLHKFANGKGQVAVTDEKTGSKLPLDEGPWTPTAQKQTVEIEESDGPRIGASSTDMLNSIKERGFYITLEANDDRSS